MSIKESKVRTVDLLQLVPLFELLRYQVQWKGLLSPVLENTSGPLVAAGQSANPVTLRPRGPSSFLYPSYPRPSLLLVSHLSVQDD